MLRVYNTLTREKEEFKPLEPGKASIYCCGVTPYNDPHIGNARPFVTWDVVRRYLEKKGYAVRYVQNFTDIDDKIIRRAKEAGETWKELADHYIAEYFKAIDALNVRRADAYPRVSEHIADVLAVIEKLIEKGYAYALDGDVYYSVERFAGYGKLSGRSLDDMQAGARVGVDERKHHPMDFALWKAAKPSEPADAAWDSPWGRGRPGWHLECSAMSRAYLGDEFDIHGGGLDLRFPHHENEQAQSHGAGWGFARYWVHNAWLTLKGEKMSKSVGNVVGVRRLLAHWPAPVVRLAVVTTHYRTNLEFSEESLQQAAALWEKFAGFVEAAGGVGAAAASCLPADSRVNAFGDPDADQARQAQLRAIELPADFVAALNEDLNVPGALPALHRAVKEGKAALNSGDALGAAQHALQLRAVLDVFGLDPLDPAWSETKVGTGDASSGDPAGTATPEAGDHQALVTLIQNLLEQRSAAKAAKDWGRADEIRDLLAASGLPVTDTPNGPVCGPVQS